MAAMHRVDRGAVALALVLAGLLAGCGSKGSEAAAPKASGPAPTVDLSNVEDPAEVAQRTTTEATTSSTTTSATTTTTTTPSTTSAVPTTIVASADGTWACPAPRGEQLPGAEVGYPSPEEAVSGLGTGARVELARTDASVTYGWRSEAGPLLETVRIDRSGDVWKRAVGLTCAPPEPQEHGPYSSVGSDIAE